MIGGASPSSSLSNDVLRASVIIYYVNLIIMNLPYPAIGPIATQLIFLVIAVGFYCFVNIAWKERKESERLKNFFLGGATLGPSLTEHATLGTTFAWANSTWFWVLMAYTYGPWFGMMQIPWCLSIMFVGYIFTKIQRVTKNKTIHGFLDDCFGSKVRVVACVATSLGYIFNTGFELYWSGRLFAFSFGREDIILPVAFAFAVITAIYCSIGGYKANAKTDKPQNLLGVFALSILALFTAFSTSFTSIQIASIIFAVGSFAYITISLLAKKEPTAKEFKFHSIFSIVMAVIAILVPLWLSLSYLLPNTPVNLNSILKSTPIPWHFCLGFLGLTVFFNIVDMANWQNIAANGDIPESEHRKLSWAFIRSALYITWFPTFGGMIIGLALRSFTAPITDDHLFEAAFSTVLPGSSQIIRGLVLGVLFLGFICTTLSSADTYLMSATHTLTYDLFYHKEVAQIFSNPVEQPETEKRFVLKAKALLLPLALTMVVVFWQAFELYKDIGGSALDFQFIMYAFAISLFTPVMFALYAKPEKNLKVFGMAALLSISLGIIAAIAPYSSAIIFKLSPDVRGTIVNLTPIISLIVSSLIFYIASRFSKKS